MRNIIQMLAAKVSRLIFSNHEVANRVVVTRIVPDFKRNEDKEIVYQLASQRQESGEPVVECSEEHDYTLWAPFYQNSYEAKHRHVWLPNLEFKYNNVKSGNLDGSFNYKVDFTAESVWFNSWGHLTIKDFELIKDLTEFDRWTFDTRRDNKVIVRGLKFNEEWIWDSTYSQFTVAETVGYDKAAYLRHNSGARVVCSYKNSKDKIGTYVTARFMVKLLALLSSKPGDCDISVHQILYSPYIK